MARPLQSGRMTRHDTKLIAAAARNQWGGLASHTHTHAGKVAPSKIKKKGKHSEHSVPFVGVWLMNLLFRSPNNYRLKACCCGRNCRLPHTIKPPKQLYAKRERSCRRWGPSTHTHTHTKSSESPNPIDQQRAIEAFVHFSSWRQRRRRRRRHQSNVLVRTENVNEL